MNEALAAVMAMLLVSAAPVAAAEQDKPARMSKEQAIERMFQKVDADGNGAIEASEARAAWQTRFERLDADGDGVINREEGMAAHRKHQRADRQGDEDRRKRAEEWRARRFAALDANGDGQVTAEEFQAKQSQVFAKADLNGDGKITKDEAAARWQGHKKRERRS